MKSFGLAVLILLSSIQTGFTQQMTKQDTLKELMRRVEILAQELEKQKLGEVSESIYESKFGMGPAASKIYTVKESGVSIAGYGEIVYNNFADEADDGSASGAINKLDYLRHIIYVGYRYNDWLLFNAEIEFEHAKAGDGQPGEVAIEFGYIEAQINPAFNLRAGLVLIPVGIINELHEPSTFHGSLRPETERHIIPSTWRANGFGLLGTFQNGFGYKLYITESLDAAQFSSGGVRSGRQNGAKAKAEDLAVSGQVNYKGIPGFDVGASFVFGNTGQDLTDGAGNDIDAGFSLFAVHATYGRKGLELRGLFAQSSVDDVTDLNNALGLTGSGSIGESQFGYYLTAAYDILPYLVTGTSHYLAPFVQYEKLNTQSDVPNGFSKNAARERTNLTVGLTYKPHPNIALKFDYINRDNEADTAVDQFNIALNYLF